MSAADARHARGATADMRSSIHNQIQVWAGAAEWVDPERAEAVFAKMGQTTEDYISPDPDTGESYREEASRIYHEIKTDYGLRTTREAQAAATEYDDRQQQAAAHALRDEFKAIGAGERDALVADIEAEYGTAFVRDVLDREATDRRDSDAGAFPTPTPPEGDTDAETPTDTDPDPAADTDTDPAPDSEPAPAGGLPDSHPMVTNGLADRPVPIERVAMREAHRILWAALVGLLALRVWPRGRTTALWGLQAALWPAALVGRLARGTAATLAVGTAWCCRTAVGALQTAR